MKRAPSAAALEWTQKHITSIPVGEVSDSDEARMALAVQPLLDLNEKLIEFVRGSRREHHPLCGYVQHALVCSCGADEFNARLDKILKDCEP